MKKCTITAAYISLDNMTPVTLKNFLRERKIGFVTLSNNEVTEITVCESAFVYKEENTRNATCDFNNFKKELNIEDVKESIIKFYFER